MRRAQLVGAAEDLGAFYQMGASAGSSFLDLLERYGSYQKAYEVLQIQWNWANATSSQIATADNVARVTEHLRSIGALDDDANLAMLARIQDVLGQGRSLSVGEENFMRHELSEAEFRAAGLSQDEAHVLASTTHPTYANYDPEVIQQYPSEFNQNWRDYWGIQ